MKELSEIKPAVLHIKFLLCQVMPVAKGQSIYILNEISASPITYNNISERHIEWSSEKKMAIIMF